MTTGLLTLAMHRNVDFLYRRLGAVDLLEQVADRFAEKNTQEESVHGEASSGEFDTLFPLPKDRATRREAEVYKPGKKP